MALEGIRYIGPDRLYLYAGKGDHLMVDLLLKHGDDPNARTSEGDTPLHACCSFCSEVILSKLLAWGADPDILGSKDEAPLHIASKKGWCKGVQLLLAAGANLHCADQGGYSPLATAIRFRQNETARQLLESGAEPR